jgi:NitT/TauT family transport system ATP-binding protein
MSINLENIDFSYPQSVSVDGLIFKNLNITFETGKITSIVGPSGTGKSTLLKLLCGLLSPSRGSIKIQDNTVEEALKKGMFGLVFQTPDLLPWRNLLKNVQLPFELQNQPVNKERSLTLLSDLGLSGWETKYPYQLSGGMQQRAAIARAIVNRPPILLLDEPFSQLDELLRFELLLYVQKYASDNNSTVVLITHDISEAVLISDKVYVLGRPPLSKFEEITVDLKRPRTFETANDSNFHSIVATVRGSLTKSKEFYQSA